MTSLRKLLHCLDRIIIGPTRREIEITRQKPSIFESDNLSQFYERVQSKFDIEFEDHEVRQVDSMDDLTTLVRVKFHSKHDEIANSHWVWGVLNRLADDYY